MGLFDKLFGKKKDDEAEPKMAPAPDEISTQVEEDNEWQEQGTPQEVQPAEVREMLEGDNPPLLLDVREQHELQASGYIPGAKHIPMAEVPNRMHELPKDKPVVVYCASGMRSFDVGFLLIENGFKNVSNLNGGFKGWDGEKASV